MQLHVDTDQESIAGLMLISRLFMDYANMKAQKEKAVIDSYPTTDDQKEFVRDVLSAHTHVASVEEASRETTSSDPDPTVIFGKFPVPKGTESPVLPPQPVLNLPGTTGPASTMSAPTTIASAVVPPVTIPDMALVSAPSQPANNAGEPSVDVDKQGIPWDERIHSSKKVKNQDGTWRLKRGLAPGVGHAITEELLRGRLPQLSTLPVPPAAAAPANLPALGTGIPPLPVENTTGLPSLPVPPAPATGSVPTPPISPVVRFSQMMAKISAALGARTISQDQVLKAHKDAGLEQLQQAVLNPDKIPQIEAILGLA